jgi:hypothetical protein
VTGKTIGKSTWFGLEQDELLSRKLLARVYGELEADGLAQDVTADWGAVIENSTAYACVCEWAAGLLRSSMTRHFAREVGFAKARHTRLIQRELAKLPEHRRQAAHRQIERVLRNFYGESEERIEAVLRVTLEAFEQDEYWTVVEAVDQARSADVATFAEALGQFGIVDMAVIGQQARRRLDFLKSLDDLIGRPETLEKDLHTAIENNLWMFGHEHALLASNETLRRTLAEAMEKTFARAKTRPDLLLCSQLGQRYVLIEFKRPSKDITRDDENQAVKYRDDLLRRFEPIDVIVIGRGRASSVDPRSGHPDLKTISYASLISDARTQLDWLIDQLRQPRSPAWS